MSTIEPTPTAEPTLSGPPAEQPVADPYMGDAEPGPVADTQGDEPAAGDRRPRRYGKRQPPVVASGERYPQQVPEGKDAYGRDEDDEDPDFFGAKPDSELGEIDVAEHHHEGGTGHDFSPAGAHRHTGWDTPHDHPRLPPRGQPPVIHPDPATFTRNAEYDPEAEWTVDHDCKASIDGHMIDFKAGQTVRGHVGRFLADTGAPVTGK